MNVLLIVIVAVFAVAAALTIVRMVIGPSILDRAVAADVLLTEVVCVMGAEMVINQHTRTLPVLLIIAATGVFGSIAVARFVARRDQPPAEELEDASDEIPDDEGAAAATTTAGDEAAVDAELGAGDDEPGTAPRGGER